MNKKKILQTVIQAVANQFDIDSKKIKGNFNFQKDLDADSIDLIELVMSLENKFSMKIPDTDVHKLTTVNDVVNYVEENKHK